MGQQEMRIEIAEFGLSEGDEALLLASLKAIGYLQ